MAALNESDTDIPQPLAARIDQVDVVHAMHPQKAQPVWVRVAVDNGTERTEQGFALAWTRQHVKVQVLWPASYYRGAREFWVEAERVQRRIIDPQWMGR